MQGMEVSEKIQLPAVGVVQIVFASVMRKQTCRGKADGYTEAETRR